MYFIRVSVVLLVVAILMCAAYSKDSLEHAPISESHSIFIEETERVGIRFQHLNGFDNAFYFIENTGGGCGFIDFNNDGWQDLLFIQSGSSKPFTEVRNRQLCALYRNRKDGTFEDVTVGSGLDKDLSYGQGVAVGDYDNDGFDDIFITAFGQNHLFKNLNGSGKFRDVTMQMGLDKQHISRYATSAAFGDYDNDGLLDLYVCYYIDWSWDADVACINLQGEQDYCSPEKYLPVSHRLYRNEGNHFRDVSKSAGIATAKGRGLAVVFLDYNNDGKQDIYVANDLTPGFLWKNLGGGRFQDVAVETGCAYNGYNDTMAGMGIALGDYNHTGKESMYVTDYAERVNPLFEFKNGVAQDVSRNLRLGLMPSCGVLSFGCVFVDYDADGWLDILTNNGHVRYRGDNSGMKIPYQQPKQLFRNTGYRFEYISSSEQLGKLAVPTVGRGLASGDYNNDGRMDVVAVNQNASVQLFRNQSATQNHWISIKTVGTKSNRNGYHAKVYAKAGELCHFAVVRAASSYLSSNDSRIYFGLGNANKVDSLEIHWASGQKDRFKNLKTNTFYIATEGANLKTWKHQSYMVIR